MCLWVFAVAERWKKGGARGLRLLVRRLNRQRFSNRLHFIFSLPNKRLMVQVRPENRQRNTCVWKSTLLQKTTLSHARKTRSTRGSAPLSSSVKSEISCKKLRRTAPEQEWPEVSIIATETNKLYDQTVAFDRAPSRKLLATRPEIEQALTYSYHESDIDAALFHTYIISLLSCLCTRKAGGRGCFWFFKLLSRVLRYTYTMYSLFVQVSSWNRNRKEEKLEGKR